MSDKMIDFAAEDYAEVVEGKHEYKKGVMPGFIRDVCLSECMYPEDCPGPRECQDYIMCLEDRYEEQAAELKKIKKFMMIL